MVHHDTKSDRPLMLLETLNVDCDQWASLLIAPIHDPLLACNPLTESGYPHLVINKCLVTIHWLQHTLWDAATSPNYHTYLAEKFQWPSTTEPHWKLFHYTQKHLNQPENKFICMFIHEWLPLRDWYHHVWSTSTNNLCPSCHMSKETVEHVLTCPHTGQWSLWHDLHDQLYKLHLTNKQNWWSLSQTPLPWTVSRMAGYTTQPNSTTHWPNGINIQSSRSNQMETTILWQICKKNWQQILMLHHHRPMAPSSTLEPWHWYGKQSCYNGKYTMNTCTQ